jgi:hypothetical protein
MHKKDTSAGFQVAKVIHRLRGGQKCSSGKGCSPQSPSSLGHLGSAAQKSPVVCAGTTLADMPIPTAPAQFRSPSECLTTPFEPIDLRALMAGIDTASKSKINKAEGIVKIDASKNMTSEQHAGKTVR